MSDPVPATSRENLRQEWHEYADSLFNRLFPQEAAAEPTPSFAHLERRTEQLSRDLAVWLLERRVNTDSQAQPGEPPPCPHCGRPGQPADPADTPLPKRTLTTVVGEMELARSRWYYLGKEVAHRSLGTVVGPYREKQG